MENKEFALDASRIETCIEALYGMAEIMNEATYEYQPDSDEYSYYKRRSETYRKLAVELESEEGHDDN